MTLEKFLNNISKIGNNDEEGVEMNDDREDDYDSDWLKSIANHGYNNQRWSRKCSKKQYTRMLVDSFRQIVYDERQRNNNKLKSKLTKLTNLKMQLLTLLSTMIYNKPRGEIPTGGSFPSCSRRNRAGVDHRVSKKYALIGYREKNCRFYKLCIVDYDANCKFEDVYEATSLQI